MDAVERYKAARRREIPWGKILGCGFPVLSLAVTALTWSMLGRAGQVASPVASLLEDTSDVGRARAYLRKHHRDPAWQEIEHEVRPARIETDQYGTQWAIPPHVRFKIRTAGASGVPITEGWSVRIEDGLAAKRVGPFGSDIDWRVEHASR